MLTDEQKRQLDTAYQTDMRLARAAVDILGRHALNPEQKDASNRAQEFMKQAEKYYPRDLAAAAELARRAKVLAVAVAEVLK
jgi:hypothetical protein